MKLCPRIQAGPTTVEKQWPAGPDREQFRLARLNRLLDEVWTNNLFYARKWRQAGVEVAPLTSLAGLASFPFTTRDELIADQTAASPLGTNLSCPPAHLKRFHRSSGTTQAPMLWADSRESWQWVLQCSQRLWRLAGVQPADRILFLMPFGLSSGPWIIHEGACRLGCACLSASPAESDEPLRSLTRFKPTVLAGRPSALQSLAVAARVAGLGLCEIAVEKLILCGAHDESLRSSLEQLWGAECFDRYGLTEAGSVAGECPAHPGGLHLLDDAFVAESIDPNTGKAVVEGEPGELVLTTLGRLARPIVRYRTGDIVRLIAGHHCVCGRRGQLLVGGVSRRLAMLQMAPSITAFSGSSPPLPKGSPA